MFKIKPPPHLLPGEAGAWGLSSWSIRLMVMLLMMTALAGLSAITHYGAVFMFDHLNLVGAVFEPVAKISLGVTCCLLFIDALVFGLACVLFYRRKSPQ